MPDLPAYLLPLFLALTCLVWISTQLALRYVEACRRQGGEETGLALRGHAFRLAPVHLYALAALSAAALGGVLMLLQLALPALIAFAASLGCPLLLPRWLRRRRRRRIDAALPDTMQLLAGTIRSGASLQQAMQNFCRENTAHVISSELQRVQNEIRVGASLDQALQNLDRRLASADVQLFVTALRIARETGGNLSETLERLADSLRQKAGAEARIRALTSQGRLQGIVVGLLPLLLMLVLVQLEPEAMRHLFDSPAGWLTLAVIVTLELAGAWLIHRIITIDV